MKAIVQVGYGDPAAVLRVQDVPTPSPGKGEALIRTRSASVAAGDWLLTTGRPAIMRLGWGLRRPRRQIPGFDLSGVIETVGEGVTGLAPGDEVFGSARSTCAEYAVAAEEAVVLKPERIGFDEAACLTVSGVTGLRAMRDHGKLQAGQKVLINGASGGVGHFAIQVAKALGAEVTGVCSAASADMVRSLGADHVLDYAIEDFTARDERYDLILDNVANHSLRATRRALKPTGVLLPNNGTAGGKLFGPLGRMLGAMATAPFIKRQGMPFEASPRPGDLLALRDLVIAGQVRPVIDRTFSLPEAAAALAHIGTGHSRGKVAITT
jgi:NADPH:quinone reductase-like Zn-dependent oxidoreductase